MSRDLVDRFGKHGTTLDAWLRRIYYVPGTRKPRLDCHAPSGLYWSMSSISIFYLFFKSIQHLCSFHSFILWQLHQHFFVWLIDYLSQTYNSCPIPPTDRIRCITMTPLMTHRTLIKAYCRFVPHPLRPCWLLDSKTDHHLCFLFLSVVDVAIFSPIAGNAQAWLANHKIYLAPSLDSRTWHQQQITVSCAETRH